MYLTPKGRSSRIGKSFLVLGIFEQISIVVVDTHRCLDFAAT